MSLKGVTSRCNYAMLRVLLRANLVHDSSGKLKSIACRSGNERQVMGWSMWHTVSFDWMRQSDQLQVLAYDLNSRKVLRHGNNRRSQSPRRARDERVSSFARRHNASLRRIARAEP